MMTKDYAPLIALVTISNSFERLRGFLERIDQTVACNGSVAVYCLIDDDDEKMVEQITVNDLQNPNHWKNIHFVMRPYPIHAHRRYFYQHVYFNQILETAPKSVDFFGAVSDKVIFLPGWDEKILAYRDAFKDGLFTLAISKTKDYFRRSLKDYIYLPENFPFYTRRWLQLSSGFGDVWGADTSLFPIHYFLSHFDYPKMCRNLVVGNVIEQDYVYGSTKAPEFRRLVDRVINACGTYMFDLKYRTILYKRALAMYMYIACYDQCGDDFEVYESQHHLHFFKKLPNGKLDWLAKHEKNLPYHLFAKYLLEASLYPAPLFGLPRPLRHLPRLIQRLYKRMIAKERLKGKQKKVADSDEFVINYDKNLEKIMEKTVTDHGTDKYAWPPKKKAS